MEELGGEGLMLRKAGSLYVGGRSTTLLKVKSFVDDEAIVKGHEAGWSFIVCYYTFEC